LIVYGIVAILAILVTGLAEASMKRHNPSELTPGCHDDLQECFPSYEGFLKSIDYRKGGTYKENWAEICYNMSKTCINGKRFSSACRTSNHLFDTDYLWSALYAWPFDCATDYEGYMERRKCFSKSFYESFVIYDNCDPNFEYFKWRHSGAWLDDYTCDGLTEVTNCMKNEMQEEMLCHDYDPVVKEEINHEEFVVGALKGRNNPFQGECEEVQDVLLLLESYYQWF